MGYRLKKTRCCLARNVTATRTTYTLPESLSSAIMRSDTTSAEVEERIVQEELSGCILPRCGAQHLAAMVNNGFDRTSCYEKSLEVYLLQPILINIHRPKAILDFLLILLRSVLP